MTPGPTEITAGSIYTFAHQAYWGFRYLRENREKLWRAVLDARSVSPLQKIGHKCASSNLSGETGYKALGAVAWLENRRVAREILNAKQHRRYPASARPSSEDRRFIFLGIAVAAGIFELSFSTCLRKLAESDLGPEYIAVVVHNMDRLRTAISANALVWAEPVGNYFYPLAGGKWEKVCDLPCDVPADWQGGFLIFGQDESGQRVTFSRELPAELKGSLAVEPFSESRDVGVAANSVAPNHVVCECGATIAASNKTLMLRALAEHKRTAHNVRSRSRRKQSKDASKSS
jgi:hypothetical protein